MLEAKKNFFFEKIFAVYNRHLFKRRFDSIQISGLEILAARNKNIPLLMFANHSSWWDGLVAFQISQTAKLDAFVMMEEKQLRKLQFFRLLGAFSVVREKPREAFKSIGYAASVLQNGPNRAVWIFPQGEIFPNDFRPLKFYRGLTKIIEKIGYCQVVPVALRFEFLGKFKPNIFAQIGELQIIKVAGDFNPKILSAVFEKQLTMNLDNLRTLISDNNLSQFEKIVW